jgi:hypothetical protein
MIDAPPHAFLWMSATFDDVLIVTPALQAWADEAAELLRADGWPTPPDLDRLRVGQTMTRYQWLWLLHGVLNPRPPCPF